MTDRSQQSGGLRVVPEVPLHHIPRQDAIAEVANALLGNTGNADPATAPKRRRGCVGVYGQGGAGKSVLAAAVARTRAVSEWFTDGVLWLSVGPAPHITTLQSQLCRALESDQVFDSPEAGRDRLAELFANFAVLVVLDDVWELEHARMFNVVGSHSRLLVTTRKRQLLADLRCQEHGVDALPMDQARALLAEWTGSAAAELPQEAEIVAERCGRLPLNLAMTGAMARHGHSWTAIHDAMDRADMAGMIPEHGAPEDDADAPGLRAVDASARALPESIRERYLDLAVFGPEEAIPMAALTVLWGMNDIAARDVVRTLKERALVVRHGNGAVGLHQIHGAYARARAGNLAERHGAFVDAYAAACPDGLAYGPRGAAPDRYFYARLVEHLICAGRHDQLRELLWQQAWIAGKLRVLGAAELYDDYTRIAGGGDIDLVRGALRLASHVILRDADQLPGQLVGRLGYFEDEMPRIRALLQDIRNHTEHPWLCPIVPTLTPPPGAPEARLSGHSQWINAVAVTADGARAVTASVDSSLKIWDLQSGAELKTLEGHSGWVRDVAVTEDGKWAVSAGDQTVKVWDMDSGAELRTFEGHGDVVNAVAVTRDGKRAISASWDETLKVWDMDSGAELRTLVGHSDWVMAVAVTQDGKRVISASGDQTLKVWDMDSGAELKTLRGHTDVVNAVAVNRDGTRAVSASIDQTVKLWDLEKGTEIETLTTFTGHSNVVNAVAMTADGTRAVSASRDQTVKVWDLQRGAEIQTFTGHSNWVMAVAVTRDGTRAISAADDKMLKVWDLVSGQPALTFSSEGPMVVCAASPKGNMFIAGDALGRVHFLRLMIPANPPASIQPTRVLKSLS